MNWEEAIWRGVSFALAIGMVNFFLWIAKSPYRFGIYRKQEED